METIRLYFKLVSISIRSQMQHRASFFMLAGSHFISTFVDILGIWVLFDRFQMVKGWTLSEVAIIYGIMHMGFAFSEAAARGFDKFGNIVRNGDFDRILLRPRGTLFQVATQEWQLMRVGRFFQGLTVLLWGCFQLQISLVSWKGFVILLSLIGTGSLFYGLFVLQATLCFWTIETLELMNITTYGGVEAGQYPMTIYNIWFQRFFTFVIPLACVAYYPIAAMLGHEDIPVWVGAMLSLSGVVFMIVASLVWEVGVRRYHSTGN